MGAKEIKKGGIMLEDIPHANPITNLLKHNKGMLKLPIRVRELMITNRSVSFMSLFSPQLFNLLLRQQPILDQALPTIAPRGSIKVTKLMRQVQVSSISLIYLIFFQSIVMVIVSYPITNDPRLIMESSEMSRTLFLSLTSSTRNQLFSKGCILLSDLRRR